MVISAHPDDEILGVGGTICKHVSDNDDVYICIATVAYEPEWSNEYIKTKVNEQKRLDKFLNIKKRYNLNFPTVKLNTIPHGDFNRKIQEVVDEVNPDIVYTHFKHDLNYDHSIVYKASNVATRPPKRIKLLCYESPSSTDWSSEVFNPNVYINIKDFMDKKIEAFKIYKSEVKEFPHPRSIKGLKILARNRGSEMCMEYAEAFMLIRDFWF
ncbi:MAG: PIG-L deacetylase family protein [Candidatus Hodarchaeota archaeon]